MIVVYATLTGQIKRFAKKLPFDTVRLTKGMVIDKDFVLITYSINYGNIPPLIEGFLKENAQHLKAVVGSGDKVWGDYFCGGAIKVSDRFNIPILHKFEKAGYQSDVDIVTTKIQELKGSK